MSNHVERICFLVDIIDNVTCKVLNLTKTLIDVDKFVLRPALKIGQLVQKLLTLNLLHHLDLIQDCVVVSLAEGKGVNF